MKKNLLLISFLVIAHFANAQVDKNAELYKIIMQKDSLLFSVGFNTCNIAQFENLLSEKFEFFHDIDSISNKSTFLINLKKGLCNSPLEYQSRRELVKNSTAIYPLYKKKTLYGAIQIGVHKFYEKIAGKKEAFGSTAKFTHLWILENGIWQLSKSLSYDHQVGNKKVQLVNKKIQ
jgi:Domain of unknown function (DUF4440)